MSQIRKNDIPGGRCLFGVVAALVPVALGACESGPNAREREARRAEGREVFKPSGAQQSGAPDEGWTIILMTFTGDDALARAESAAASLRQSPALAQASAQERRQGAVVVLGDYPGPTDPRARKDLERVRSLTVGGKPVLAASFLAPRSGQSEGAIGSLPQLSLTEARREHGQGVLYTLQVAVYESDDRVQAMRQAERAAADLRAEGEMAFYHHGRQRSMVTIGLFGPDAVDPSTGELSPELETLKKRRPYNLYNGQGIAERVGGSAKSRLQGSQLVAVP